MSFSVALVKFHLHKPNLESTSKYGFPPNWGGKWRRSEHAYASYLGLPWTFFSRRPGSAPIWGGKKGEFRDWNILGRALKRTWSVYILMSSSVTS